MLSYFKYYIRKTQQARKSIVLSSVDMPLRSGLMFGGVWSHKWEGVGSVRGVEISLVSTSSRRHGRRTTDTTGGGGLIVGTDHWSR